MQTRSTITPRKRPASQISKRESSPELGEDASFVKRNSKTGKPMRNNAGKRTTLPAGFVASDVAIKEDEAGSDSDYVEDDGEGLRQSSWGPKRRRYSPLPPELSPEPEVDLDEEQPELASSAAPPGELSVTFNVPPGHKGAFVVKFDLASILGVRAATEPTIPTPSLTPAISVPATVPQKRIGAGSKSRASSRPTEQAKAGFLDLPAELRNFIYSQVLISKTPIDFRDHSGFSHCGAFLSTCRQVYQEGTQILYGDNEYKLARDSRQRGNYWSPWTEIGWKDVRRFLTTIGPDNMSKLRNLSITLEDPPHRADHNPNFVNDDHLMECLKLLANHGQLQTLSLSIHGKAMVKKFDARFLANLKALKADKCKIVGDPTVRGRSYYGTWYSGRRVANVALGLDQEIVKKIERKHKLYEVTQ